MPSKLSAAPRRAVIAASVRPQRSREVPEVRRKLLIEATTRSIAKYGYDGTTIERICGEAGVSRGLINHHFGTKEGLVLESYRQLCEEWAYFTHDMMDADVEPEVALRAAIERNFNPQFFKQEYLGIWLGFWSVIPKSPGLRKLDRALNKLDLRNFQNLIERLIRKRRLRLDSRLQAIGLMALIDGLWLQWALDPKSFGIDEARAVCLGSVGRLLE